jgi:hypothetical protein
MQLVHLTPTRYLLTDMRLESDQLLHKIDHAASSLDTHLIFTDRYETRKIVGIELISE